MHDEEFPRVQELEDQVERMQEETLLFKKEKQEIAEEKEKLELLIVKIYWFKRLATKHANELSY